MVKQFLRRSNDRYGKLGKGIKKNQKWRKPTGRDNKMREKRRGYAPVVSIGYRTEKNGRDTLKEKTPVYVYNVADLLKVKSDEIALIGKVGNKKKEEIAKVAKEKKIAVFNLNANKFLKNVEKQKAYKKKKLEEVKKKTEKKETKKEETKSEEVKEESQ